ncbi:hypothetical protein ABZP36_034396 [Zizania latifolia]
MAGQATWWWWPLPSWMLPGSTAAWFVVLNVVVCAVAVLSSRARPSQTPRGRGGVARRASSSAAALQCLRSSFIFSYPSALFYPSLQSEDIAEPRTPTPRKPTAVSYPLQPDDAAEPRTPTPRKPTAVPYPSQPDDAAEPPPRTPTPRKPPAPAPKMPAAQPETEEGEDANSISMEEAYALALAARHRPPPTEEEARRSEVDAKAEEFISGFKDDQRKQRLDSIFNYTQMLKLRAAAFAGGRRKPAAQL